MARSIKSDGFSARTSVNNKFTFSLNVILYKEARNAPHYLDFNKATVEAGARKTDKENDNFLSR
jgi:hypothetical protein